jgi:hypothetical protein
LDLILLNAQAGSFVLEQGFHSPGLTVHFELPVLSLTTTL